MLSNLRKAGTFLYQTIKVVGWGSLTLLLVVVFLLEDDRRVSRLYFVAHICSPDGQALRQQCSDWGQVVRDGYEHFRCYVDRPDAETGRFSFVVVVQYMGLDRARRAHPPYNVTVCNEFGDTRSVRLHDLSIPKPVPLASTLGAAPILVSTR